MNSIYNNENFIITDRRVDLVKTSYKLHKKQWMGYEIEEINGKVCPFVEIKNDEFEIYYIENNGILINIIHEIDPSPYEYIYNNTYKSFNSKSIMMDKIKHLYSCIKNKNEKLEFINNQDITIYLINTNNIILKITDNDSTRYIEEESLIISEHIPNILQTKSYVIYKLDKYSYEFLNF